MAKAETKTTKQKEVKLPTMEELFKVGAYFGHKRERFNPGNKEFIFGVRNGISIINLEKTVEYLKKAADFLHRKSSEGASFLVVGTKREIREIAKKMAQDLELSHATERWLGGMLTNFETVRKSLKRLEETNASIKNAKEEGLTKKEVGLLQEKSDVLERELGGFKNLPKVPDILVVFDLNFDKIAAVEAKKLGIPVVGILDTNADRKLAEYPVPASDDAPEVVAMIAKVFAEAIRAGRK